jgi:hypothetical protein
MHLLSKHYRDNTNLTEFSSGYATTQAVYVHIIPYDRARKIYQGIVDARDLKDGKTTRTCFRESWRMVREDNIPKIADTEGEPIPGECPI